MTKNIKFEEIIEILHPEIITRESYDIFNREAFWYDFHFASWAASESPAIAEIFEKLKSTLILYCKNKKIEPQEDLRKEFELETNQLYEQVLKIHSNLKTDLELFKINKRKEIRNKNFYFYISIVLLYILLIAFLSKSLRPSDWYNEFIYHLHLLGRLITGLIGYAMALGGFFLGVFIYIFLVERITKHRGKGYISTIIVSGIGAFILTLTVLLVLNNGIKSTFGVDPLDAVKTHPED